MTYVILPISAGRWQHANTQQPIGVVGLVIIHVNGPAPNHDTPSDTTDNISEVRETTQHLGKPGLVDPVPDVEDLFLDLLLAGVVSTQHTVQLNIQTHIHSKLHSTFTIIIIIIIFIRTKSTNTEKQLTQQYRL